MTDSCVYILYSESLNKYYVGASEDLERRLHFHNHPIESRKFTSKGIPWVLKIKMSCDSKQHAMRIEQFIKRMKSKSFIERLIEDVDLRDEIIKNHRPDC